MKDIKFKYNNTLIDWNKVQDTANTLSSYREHLSSIADGFNEKEVKYIESESSINLPFDINTYKEIKKVVEKVHTKSLKYIIIIGIGGSNLGTKAVLDGIRGTVDSFLEADTKTPKIIFAGTTSSKLLDGIRNILKENIEKPEEVLVNVVSKSGTTTETMANFEIIYSFLKKHFGDSEILKNRIVITTDQESVLWNIARENKFELIAIPKNIVGRYSVFSSVGLFPLILSGVNTEQLLNGARVMRKACLKEDLLDNPALTSAVLIYLHNKKGISINNTFFFNPHIESIGKWYRQLLGESIGKKYSTDGKEVNTGITPIISIGSADLHSMTQLYLGGPKDKFTTFVYATEKSKEIIIPKNIIFPGLVDGMEGKELSSVMDAIFMGTKKAYKKNQLPFLEIILKEINEYTIGQFLQFKMIEMMYLASLFKVNAFDQPSVEDYKEETREILQKQKDNLIF